MSLDNVTSYLRQTSLPPLPGCEPAVGGNCAGTWRCPIPVGEMNAGRMEDGGYLPRSSRGRKEKRPPSVRWALDGKEAGVLLRCLFQSLNTALAPPETENDKDHPSVKKSL